MANVPSYSQFIAIKKVQAIQTANTNTSIIKNRAPSPYISYFPLYKTVRFPVNALLSNKFTNLTVNSEISGPSIPAGYSVLLARAATTFKTTDFKTYTQIGNTSGDGNSNHRFRYFSNSELSVINLTNLSTIPMVLSTNNGNSFESVGVSLPNIVADVYFTGATYYALSASFFYKSTNRGSSWTQIVSFSPPIGARFFFVRGTNFIISGPRTLFASTDGITFTNIESLVGNSQFAILSIIFNSGTYYLFGYDYDNDRNFRLTTTDLANFSRINSATTYKFLSIKQNATVGIMVGLIEGRGVNDSGIKWSTDNGVTWNNATGTVATKGSSASATILNIFVMPKLCFTGGAFIAILSDDTAHYSIDGKIWYLITNIPFVPQRLGLLFNDETGQF